MQTYETVVLIKPKLSDPEVAEFIDKIKKFIAKEGGEILNEDRWGRRKLAYPIKQARESFYLYLKFQAPGAVANRLSQHLRIADPTLRAMTVNCPPRKAAPEKAKA